MPGIELRSGSGYEFTNQIHFTGCVFESFYGTAIASTGTNTNEIFFQNTKIESLQTNKPLLTFTDTNMVHFGGLQVYSKGTATNTIDAQIVLSNCNTVGGIVYLEHGTGGATLTNYVKIENSEAVNLDVMLEDGGDNISGSQYVLTSGNANTQINCFANKGSAPKDYAGSDAPNLRVNNIRIQGRTEPHIRFQNSDDGTGNVWYLGRVPDTGEYLELQFNGTSEIEVFRYNLSGEALFNRGLRLARLTTAPTASDGMEYFDNTTDIKTLRRYINGGWQRVGRASAAPTAGAWSLGDIVYNTAPTAGGFVGWVCVTAGTPGTWKTFGAISA